MLFLEDFLELEFDSLLDLLFAAYDEAMDILLSTSGCKCMGTLHYAPREGVMHLFAQNW